MRANILLTANAAVVPIHALQTQPQGRLVHVRNDTHKLRGLWVTPHQRVRPVEAVLSRKVHDPDDGRGRAVGYGRGYLDGESTNINGCRVTWSRP
ncbi:hypothetical protein KXV97_005944 [Aspergillus fumigatus]|nr:hypothetical protein KXV97_005944 [Aspergillus fumigatus]KAH2875271.1 hypothetical protein KXW22_005013 [Aspergillus fumigatus]